MAITSDGGKEMSHQDEKSAAHQSLEQGGQTTSPQSTQRAVVSHFELMFFVRELNSWREVIKEMSLQYKKVAEGMKRSDKKLFISCHS
jgi:hypothetical protein